MNNQLLHNIAITCLPNIGEITAKKLIAYCGSAEMVFSEKKAPLEKIPGIGKINAQHIFTNKKEALETAEKELKFIEKNQINPIFFLDEAYPKRLTHCEDSPVVLYTKGNMSLNAQKVISIVGTRKATDYGREFCEKLVADLAPHQPLIVSGLAFGIDICAHKAAINNNLSTVAALAHGLDRIYPNQHGIIAKQMQENGGIISEFKHETNPDRENFPKRNRIVAGLADLTIVIESSKKGGSLITADLANQYNRDVFALPGRLNDEYSEGCNWLIKTNKAALIQSAKDIEYIMGWETTDKKKSHTQTKLFVELSDEEKAIIHLLSSSNKIAIDSIALQAAFPMSKTAALLLNLEFNGVVKSYPGKMYKLV
ncbi:MAG: DNA-protecting protein DprA [Bacteroidetes bacterium HGW-Bacteroidetes-12]|jgi:DNA processing protein|nr:MAG: DNA-protecting protein DprA [Bacteroidetes bacterium HGW-Bacteroidetes-12]